MRWHAENTQLGRQRGGVGQVLAHASERADTAGGEGGEGRRSGRARWAGKEREEGNSARVKKRRRKGKEKKKRAREGFWE